MLVGIDGFVRLPAELREVISTCPMCAKLVVFGRDDDASQSLQQRIWWHLVNRPVTRSALTDEQRAMLAALTAAAEKSLGA